MPESEQIRILKIMMRDLNEKFLILESRVSSLGEKVNYVRDKLNKLEKK